MMEKSRPVKFVSFSTALHGVAIASIMLTAPLKQRLPEGNQELTTVEFVAKDMSQGQQIKVIDAPATSTRPQPPQDVAAAKVIADTPKPKPKKAAVTQQLPKKVETPVEPKEEPVKDSDMVAVVPTETPATETQDDSPVETLEPVQEKVDATSEEVAETEPEPAPIVAAKPNSESSDSEAAAARINDSKDEPQAEKLAAPQSSNSTAPAPFGVSEGTRSYLDLQQRPGNRPPEYPVTARRQNQQGSVELKYYVTAEGQVSQMQMTKSSGYPTLDQEAVRAISQYRYVPGQEGWTVHPVTFNLQGPVAPQPTRLRTMGSSSNGGTN